MITDTETLSRFCASLRGADYVTVDTEFIRESTYWPILCLVQLGGPDDARAIDTLAPGIDLAPLFELLIDEDILKVFHASRQDLEIFHHLMGRVPTPLFDTQVAAMVCGFGDSVGYETLIRKLTNTELDKGSRFTDWSARPLSDRQLAYALADVTHLRPAYEKLARKLEKTGRAAWVAEEMAVLENPMTYDPDPRDSYKRIKSRGAKGRTVAVLRELAAWREIEAKRVNVPRNRILRDEALVEIAHHTPKDAAALERTRGLGKRLAEGRSGEAILAAVKRGLTLPKDEWPVVSERPKLPHGIGPMADLMKVLLKMRAEDAEVASRLIANSDDVDRIAGLGEKANVQALTGWRREAFGNDALRLRRGEIALTVRGKRLVVVDTPAAENTPEPAPEPVAVDVAE